MLPLFRRLRCSPIAWSKFNRVSLLAGSSLSSLQFTTNTGIESIFRDPRAHSLVKSGHFGNSNHYFSITPAAVVDTAKGALDAANGALNLYDKVLDKVIPWQTFEDSISELTKYESDYSNKAGQIVGEIKTLLMNSRNEYFAATKSVYEWCGLTAPLLTAFLILFDQNDEASANGQKIILLKVLSEGVIKLNAAQEKLMISSKSFNSASGKLNLEKEIKIIDEMKITTDTTNVFLDLSISLKDMWKQSGKKLLGQCKSYIKRHSS